MPFQDEYDAAKSKYGLRVLVFGAVIILTLLAVAFSGGKIPENQKEAVAVSVNE